MNRPEQHPTSDYDPPHDTGVPDSVETDAAALSSAEDLDEDRLRQDPQEEAMDPPEHWSGATKYGMTPWEEAHPQPLTERLAQEQPDIGDDAPPPDPDTPEPDRMGVRLGDEDLGTASYEENLGISADIAGGSAAQEMREPPLPAESEDDPDAGA